MFAIVLTTVIKYQIKEYINCNISFKTNADENLELNGKMFITWQYLISAIGIHLEIRGTIV